MISGSRWFNNDQEIPDTAKPERHSTLVMRFQVDKSNNRRILRAYSSYFGR